MATYRVDFIGKDGTKRNYHPLYDNIRGPKEALELFLRDQAPGLERGGILDRCSLEGTVYKTRARRSHGEALTDGWRFEVKKCKPVVGLKTLEKGKLTKAFLEETAPARAAEERARRIRLGLPP